MTVDIASLVSDNLDIWTTAVERKSGAGRGGGKRISLYGIDRLRPLIVDLAVRGKLTSQQPDEEPAAMALTKLAKARRRKIEAGHARKPKALSPLSADLPTLPEGWEWTQLGTITEISPSNSADDQVDASFVPMVLVSTRIDGAHETETRKWGEIKKGFTHFAEGDVGLAKITPCFENGKAAIFENLVNCIGAGTTELHVARPWSDDVNRRYLLLTMKTASYLHEGEVGMTGTAGQKRVTRSYFESSPLPLPPLAEQERIVAKVDELMALCYALEAESAAAMAAHQALVEALLATLTTSTGAADLASNWARLEAHFDTLFTTEASVDSLKQTILELAVRGRLVEQDSGKQSANGKIKPKAAQSAPPFDIPPTWQLQSLKSLGRQIGGGTPSKSRMDFWDGPIPWVSPKDMKKDYLTKAELSVSEAALQGSSIKMIPPESLLFVVRGMILAHSFPVAIAKAHVTINQDMKAIELDQPEMAEYLLRALKGLKPLMLAKVERSSHGTCRLDAAAYGDFLIPIPPLAEQLRIVAKIDELMVLCDALKGRITDGGTIQKYLADTIVEKAAA